SNGEGIVEASDGALWIGTEGGLDRLDARSGAYVFTSFPNPARAANATSNRIRSLLLDKNGRLWIGSECRLHLFYRKSGRFVRVPLPGVAGEALARGWVASLYEDPIGQISAGTPRGRRFRPAPA